MPKASPLAITNEERGHGVAAAKPRESTGWMDSEYRTLLSMAVGLGQYRCC